MRACYFGYALWISLWYAVQADSSWYDRQGMAMTQCEMLIVRFM